MVEASPSASTWYRQALLGESQSKYFLLETRWLNRGTYYQHVEFQRILVLDKYTDALEDTILIRKAVFSTDLNTGQVSVREEATPSFDLSEFLRRNSISAPFTLSWSPTQLDSLGLFYFDGDTRITVFSIEHLRERIPASREFYEELQFLGAEFTTAPTDSGVPRMTYYRVGLAPAGGDTDGVELVVRVPGGP